MTMIIGLRFPRSQARVLRNLAERVRAGDLAAGVTVFDRAAVAAATGEPLVVICQHPSEVEAIADKLVRFGVTRPAIEALTPGG